MLENILRNVNIYRLAYEHGEFIGLKPRFEIKNTTAQYFCRQSNKNLVQCIPTGRMKEIT
jgi:hypothetical protein